jgi:DNA-binding MarR family transcriptional regulator
MQKPMFVPDLLTTRLLRLSNTLSLYSNRRYPQEFDVSLPEWRVMSIIAAGMGATAREISRVLATDKAWVGLSVKKLAKRGYVTRSADPKDTRRVLLAMTKLGREKHDAIMAVARQRQSRLLAALAPGMADAFGDSLDRLQREAEAMLEELGPPVSDDSDA